jgi:hypothetical protein
LLLRHQPCHTSVHLAQGKLTQEAMSVVVGSNHSNITRNNQHACHNRYLTFVVKNRLEHTEGRCNTRFRASSGVTPGAISRGSPASLFRMNSNLFRGMSPSTCSTRATPWLSVYVKPYISMALTRGRQIDTLT